VVKKGFIIGLGVAAIFLLVGILARTKPPESLVYQGKTVKGWVVQLTTPEPNAREQAAAAIKALGSNAVPGLVRLLETRDSFFRKRVWAFASQLPVRVRQVVLPRIRPPDAALIRSSAARSLGLLGPDAETAIPALSKSLRSGDAHAQWDAAGALGGIGKSAMPDLIAALGDRDPNVRRAGAYGLGEAGSHATEAAPALLVALEDPSAEVQVAAVATWSKWGADLFPWITNAMASPDPATRKRAAKVLPVIRPDRALAVPSLIGMLRDEEAACRIQAVQTLGTFQLPNPMIVDALTGALKDPVTEVRFAAAKALGQTAGKIHRQAAPAVAGLTQSLSDSSPLVREAAALALGKFGAAAEPAMADLSRLTGDQVEPVRMAASGALAKIGAAEEAIKEQ
jgi:HEAT repeat protein